MKPKLFYRVANVESQQGLWYNFNGEFTGLIHNEFKFCTNHNLPMPFTPELVGWLSATETLEELFFWFTEQDITELEKFGFKITLYEANEYKIFENHWIIKQDESVVKEILNLQDCLV